MRNIMPHEIALAGDPYLTESIQPHALLVSAEIGIAGGQRLANYGEKFSSSRSFTPPQSSAPAPGQPQTPGKPYVILSQIRKVPQHFLMRHPRRQISEHIPHRHPQPADAWLPAALSGLHGIDLRIIHTAEE
jgi:hypothetical protein